MQRHAHPQRVQRRGPGGCLQGALGGEGGGHGLVRQQEGGGEAVATALKDDPLLGAQRGAQQGVVLRQGLLHGGGVVLPAARAALDVGEQEGDRAGRQGGQQRGGRASGG